MENTSIEGILKAQRKELRVELKDSFNRIHSIFLDAQFVSNVAESFSFAVVPNQRCGLWYCIPATAPPPYAYFKSTDGHIGQHSFNVRRANLSLIPIIIEQGGILIVDSTRRGKRFPDALSKTIPIWCAVLNLAAKILFPSEIEDLNWTENGKLWTLLTCVGRSEHDQIEKQVLGWAKILIASGFNLDFLAELKKPLRPLFVSPSSTLPSVSTDYPNFYPVVCVSASTFSAEGDDWSRDRELGWSYVQGAGDDHEQWSAGLTPKLLWTNQEIIKSASRDELDLLIKRIVTESSLESLVLKPSSSLATTRIRSTLIYLAFTTETDPTPVSDSKIIIINASKSPTLPTAPPLQEKLCVTFTAKTGKMGHNAFFTDIDRVLNQFSFVEENQSVHILVTKTADSEQSEANDLGLAIALILLAQEFDESGEICHQTKIDKTSIRARLIWILETFTKLNPSRGILIRVNEFLLSKRRLNS